MKLVKIERKDVWVTLEFSAEQLYWLKILLDHAKIEYDSEEDPDMAKADDYLQNHFYEFLKYFDEEGKYKV